MLRYPGGKTRAIPTLEQFLPNDVKSLVSPFFGGGSFELYLMNTRKIPVIANDKFEPLLNFWRMLQSDSRGLYEKVKSMMPITKEVFIQCKECLFDTSIDNLTRATYYYIINRCSFSGSTCSGGYSKEAAEKRLTLSCLERMLTFDSTNIRYTNQDFTTFLSIFDEDEFIFADPPYYLGSKSKLYGSNGDLHESFDHKALYECLKIKKRWMLCYNDCEYIRELYKEYRIVEVDWSYGMNKTKKSSEILILSY